MYQYGQLYGSIEKIPLTGCDRWIERAPKTRHGAIDARPDEAEARPLIAMLDGTRAAVRLIPASC
jgi:hypothetical protein